MGWKAIILLCAVCVFSVGCEKKAAGSPSAPTSATQGAVHGVSSVSGTWTLYNVDNSTPVFKANSSGTSDYVFSGLDPGTYSLTFVNSGGIGSSSPAFQVQAAQTTTVTYDGSSYSVSGPA